MRTRSNNLKEIAQLLVWGSEQCHKISSSPRLDAEILLTFVLNKPRSYCRTWPDKVLSDEHAKQFEALITLRLKPTPIAYIVGFKEFWSRDFKVTASTLVPRPETELLLEKALGFLSQSTKKQTVLDLGTGSGCVAISLQLECSNCSVMAVDNSVSALAVANENAQRLHSDVVFVESSWFKQIEPQLFDLIVSNPPYIPQADEHLSQGDLVAEPLSALSSGDDGLDDIRVLTQQAPNFLKVGGMLMIEHGYDQKEAVYQLLKSRGFKDIQQYDDLSGQARLSSGVKPSL